jgi:hypothetical protein
MTSRVLELEKKYIVYKFYEDDKYLDFQLTKFFRDLKITEVPVLLVFNNGQEVKRYPGIVELAMVTAGVKDKAQQQTPYDWRAHDPGFGPIILR